MSAGNKCGSRAWGAVIRKRTQNKREELTSRSVHSVQVLQKREISEGCDGWKEGSRQWNARKTMAKAPTENAPSREMPESTHPRCRKV
jgi:hypothetical protein